MRRELLDRGERDPLTRHQALDAIRVPVPITPCEQQRAMDLAAILLRGRAATGRGSARACRTRRRQDLLQACSTPRSTSPWAVRDAATGAGTTCYRPSTRWALQRRRRHRTRGRGDVHGAHFSPSHAPWFAFLSRQIGSACGVAASGSELGQPDDAVPARPCCAHVGISYAAGTRVAAPVCTSGETT